MATWLSDASANRHIKTYVKDFLDISGNMTIRHGDLDISGGYLGIGTDIPRTKIEIPVNDAYNGLSVSRSDVKMVLGHESTVSNAGTIQVYSGVTDATPDATSSTYNLTLNPYGGNVGIGTHSTTRNLSIYADSYPTLQLANSDSGGAANNGLEIFQGGNSSTFNNRENGNMNFSTNNAQRMFISNGGNVAIGTTTANYRLRVQGNCYVSSTFQTGSTITSGGLRPGTNTWNHGGGGSGSANHSHHIYFQTSSGGRHPAILATSDYVGFQWGGGGTYATKAAIGQGGFGTFTGQHRVCIKDVGLRDIPVVKHDVATNELNEDGETRIDAWEKEAVDNDYIGRIVCANQNKFIRISGGVETGLKGITINEALPLTCLSTKANDKSCFGVISGAEDENNRTGGEGHFLSYYDKEKGDARLYVNSLGEGSMWVTNTNGNFESGDYITSSNLIGYGQKQDSEFLSNYTVAKITMDCNFSPITQEQQCILKDASGNNILDSKNQFQWTNKIDSSGNILYEKEYHIRYLDDKAIRITEEEYNAKIAASEEAYIAAFVGCTYHCG